jgi:ribosomal protein L11 methyltransferase
MNYLEYRFSIAPLDPAREVLVAELADWGFESFLETETGLLAYIPEPSPEGLELDDLMAYQMPDVTISVVVELIPRENWNAKWEAGFEPIYVDDAITVRAPFHVNANDARYTLIVQPKMSFGTGHHDTTWLMMKAMLDLDLDGRPVLDMGSGTGILAILAAKRGASYVEAIDIDDWAEENARENAALNEVNITCFTGNADLLDGKSFNTVLANINRNVLMADLPRYAKVTEPGGNLLLSGFFKSDAEALIQEAQRWGFTALNHTGTLSPAMSKNDWCCLRFVRG